MLHLAPCKGIPVGNHKVLVMLSGPWLSERSWPGSVDFKLVSILFGLWAFFLASFHIVQTILAFKPLLTRILNADFYCSL